MRRLLSAALALLLALLLSACAAEGGEAAPLETVAPAVGEAAPAETGNDTEEEREMPVLQMLIGETAVAVDWEENASVEALKELCREEPLTIALSMYGGFEQVGAIGTRLSRSDVQTTTASGDIVLYAGDQIVVFYGSNSWAYTRLGHITDQSAAGMEALLGHGDVSRTLRWED